jgi:hypothetical protein
VCVAAAPSASSYTSGKTTWYNRQESVLLVCEGFGGDARFDAGPGVACSIIAAATGPRFPKASLFTDGFCSGAELAMSGPSTSGACSMLADLLGSAPIPVVKAFAVGSGVACSLGHPFGDWIESMSERNAARAVIQEAKCLRFRVRSFPFTDTWDAVDCQPGDPGPAPQTASASGISHTTSSGAAPTVTAQPGGGGNATGILPAGHFYVMNADGGVYWRSGPSWALREAVAGNGFYPGTVIAVSCWQRGPADVPGSANGVWDQATWASGPGRGQGWINEHFIDDGAALNQPAAGVPQCASEPPPPPPPPASTWSETVGGVTHTWTNYTNAGGTQGPSIQTGQTVQVACKVQGFRVAEGYTWWYRIASSPWNSVYYASADAFYNNGSTSGSLIGTPFVDPAVASC